MRMINKYNRLTLAERKLIEKLLARGCSFNEIADFLSRPASTVSLVEVVVIGIFTEMQWSPVQIAESLKMDYPDDMTMHISPESIYTYIYVLPKGFLKKELLRCLRHPRKRRHCRRDTAMTKAEKWRLTSCLP